VSSPAMVPIAEWSFPDFIARSRFPANSWAAPAGVLITDRFPLDSIPRIKSDKPLLLLLTGVDIN
jgi:hypothetical protein